MIAFSPLIQALVQSFRCLPGVGPKSAQRMALTLLERDREGGLALGQTLQESMTKIGRCERCRLLCEESLCGICTETSRNDALLCVVGSPADVLAIEQTASFRGRYFVLSGYLSPIDGIGPNEIGLPQLKPRLVAPVQELILALSPTVEGEATAYYIAQMAKAHAIPTSRIAHGVPRGSELEYIDSATLAQALAERDILA